MRDPVELIDEGAAGPIVLTCEHASNRLPDGWGWGEDAWLAPTHWAWDPGAAAFTAALARRFQARAALASFSRLVIDPNRPLDSETLIRVEAEGRRVGLNHGLGPTDRHERVERCWTPFHAAADRVVASSPASLLVSIHSFTPVYEGQVREVELGVLFDEDEALAHRLIAELSPSGFAVRANEPYSGRGGLMYSASKHARAHGKAALELELRQDLLADPAGFARLLDAVERGLAALVG